VAIDEARAIALYTRAADRGHAHAIVNLGVCFQVQHARSEESIQTANQWQISEQSLHFSTDTRSLFGLSILDTLTLFHLFQEYCENIVSTHFVRLSLSLIVAHLTWPQSGLCGVERNAARAIALYRCGAKLNDAASLYNLGACYQSGLCASVEREQQRLQKQKQQQLEHGSDSGGSVLKTDRDDGATATVAANDIRRAAVCFARGALLGDADSLCCLGYCCLVGASASESPAAADSIANAGPSTSASVSSGASVGSGIAGARPRSTSSTSSAANGMRARAVGAGLARDERLAVAALRRAAAAPLRLAQAAFYLGGCALGGRITDATIDLAPLPEEEEQQQEHEQSNAKLKARSADGETDCSESASDGALVNRGESSAAVGMAEFRLALAGALRSFIRRHTQVADDDIDDQDDAGDFRFGPKSTPHVNGTGRGLVSRDSRLRRGSDGDLPSNADADSEEAAAAAAKAEAECAARFRRATSVAALVHSSSSASSAPSPLPPRSPDRALAAVWFARAAAAGHADARRMLAQLQL
jgi:TPR repeat protein